MSKKEGKTFVPLKRGKYREISGDEAGQKDVLMSKEVSLPSGRFALVKDVNIGDRHDYKVLKREGCLTFKKVSFGKKVLIGLAIFTIIGALPAIIYMLCKFKYIQIGESEKVLAEGVKKLRVLTDNDRIYIVNYISQMLLDNKIENVRSAFRESSSKLELDKICEDFPKVPEAMDRNDYFQSVIEKEFSGDLNEVQIILLCDLIKRLCNVDNPQIFSTVQNLIAVLDRVLDSAVCFSNDNGTVPPREEKISRIKVGFKPAQSFWRCP